MSPYNGAVPASEHDSEPQQMIRALGLSKRYGTGGREIEVLNGFDLTLDRGESLSLLGVSGTGKTTVLNILGGIESADAGTLEIAGRTLGSDPSALTRHRQQNVGFVFQFFNLLPSLTALENVLAGLEARGPLTAVAQDRAAAALRDVGLGERADAFPAELSGGQQQRVAIARALAKDAPLVLADEPTGNLDPHTAEEVLGVLIGQCRAAGSTLVIVTHNQAIAERTDRSARLVDGRLEPQAIA